MSKAKQAQQETPAEEQPETPKKEGFKPAPPKVEVLFKLRCVELLKPVRLAHDPIPVASIRSRQGQNDFRLLLLSNGWVEVSVVGTANSTVLIPSSNIAAVTPDR